MSTARYRTLNTSGNQALRTWIKNTAREPQKHHLDYWYGYAQNVLNAYTGSESLSIEMPGRDTRSGQVERLTLQPDHHQWEADEAATV